ncbi:MAG: succinate dehydrogenase assembly factor 2 [Spiribacter sp.]|nr:succinate dehydrogenase assembly factor 2 [Spiribacter sp.]MDR9480537.1 succinate dehydrogenase assembly factor 2 [Spiribacter sp.]
MSDLSRLRWRCRRGTTELDRLLNRFLDADANANGYAALDAAGRADFERLLVCEDDLLIDWLLNGYQPEEGTLADIVQRIRAVSGLSA